VGEERVPTLEISLMNLEVVNPATSEMMLVSVGLRPNAHGVLLQSKAGPPVQKDSTAWAGS
jgi:hypothetical protein